jgi:hypothetical protein
MAESTTAAKKAPVEEGKKSKERSPGYPGISLETALARVKEFHDIDKRNSASVSVVAQHWGMTPKSSSTLINIAALKAFGLISDSGLGEKRRVQVSDLARRILLDERPDSEERANAIKTAALNPKMHRMLWNKWGNEIPSDANMRQTLIFDYKFNPNTVGDFIRVYRATIRFAKLGESDRVSPEVNEGGEESGSTGIYVPKVGDYVQWEPSGILQFQEPKPITNISGDGDFAFVEGSSTGLPVSQLVPQPKPERVSAERAMISSPLKSNMRQDVFSLNEGTCTIQWPTNLSPESLEDIKDWLKIVERKIARSTSERTTIQAEEKR